VIYFIKCNEFVKIGFTDAKDATGRLKAMQTGNPYSLEIIGTMPGGMYHEQRLHILFRELNERGEWFKLAPEILHVIEQQEIPEEAHITREVLLEHLKKYRRIAGPGENQIHRLVKRIISNEIPLQVFIQQVLELEEALN